MVNLIFVVQIVVVFCWEYWPDTVTTIGLVDCVMGQCIGVSNAMCVGGWDWYIYCWWDEIDNDSARLTLSVYLVR